MRPLLQQISCQVKSRPFTFKRQAATASSFLKPNLGLQTRSVPARVVPSEVDIFSVNQMSWALRVVNAYSSDSYPAFEVRFASGAYLFEAPEGLQRSYNQNKLKLGKAQAVFLSGLQSEQTGGIFGCLMTLADQGVTQMKLVGPENVKNLVASARGSFKRAEINVEITEVPVSDPTAPTANGTTPVFKDSFVTVFAVPTGDRAYTHSRKRKRTESSPHSPSLLPTPPLSNAPVPSFDNLAWREQIINHMLGQNFSKNPSNPQGKQQQTTISPSNVKVPQDWMYRTLPLAGPSHHKTLSYICIGPSVRGKFNVKKALELGIPKGPLYAKLTKGESVTLADGRVVEAETVMDPPHPSSVLIVVDCPNEASISDVISNRVWKAYQTESPAHHVHVVIHKYGVWRNPDYLKWAESFGVDALHLDGNVSSEADPLTYASHALAQMRLSLLNPDFFKVPYYQSSSEATSLPSPLANSSPFQKSIQIDMHPRGPVIPMVTDTSDNEAFPSASTGFDASKEIISLLERDLPDYVVAATAARKAVAVAEIERNGRMSEPGDDIVVTTLGTGSSIPSKYRNVSSTHLQVPGLGGILLDSGEGTLGQLSRFFGPSIADRLQELKLIFISHMHADHHTGLPLLLKGWYEINVARNSSEPLYIIAPSPIRTILEELSSFQDMGLYVDGPIKFIDSYHLNLFKTKDVPLPEQYASSYQLLLTSLSLSEILVPVVPHRGSRCYGVSISHNDGWKISYSGDTMPSDSLVAAGMNSTLLIHEATMEDDLAEMAKFKGHSTIGQAIDVGRRMKAKNVLLTHFSQRYSHLARVDVPTPKTLECNSTPASEPASTIPSTPPHVTDHLENTLAFSSDFMSVPIGDMWKMAFYREAIEKLFAETEKEDEDGELGDRNQGGTRGDRSVNSVSKCKDLEKPAKKSSMNPPAEKKTSNADTLFGVDPSTLAGSEDRLSEKKKKLEEWEKDECRQNEHRLRMMDSAQMKWSVRVLNENTSDSHFSLEARFDGGLYIFDSPEGFSRSYNQNNLSDTRSRAVFLSGLDTERAGGIFDFLMRIADKGVRQLKLVGPENLGNFIAAARNWFTRPEMNVEIIEVSVSNCSIEPVFSDAFVKVYAVAGQGSNSIVSQEQVVISNEDQMNHKRAWRQRMLSSILGQDFEDFNQLFQRGMKGFKSSPAVTSPRPSKPGLPVEGIFDQLPLLYPAHSKTLSYICVGPEVRGKFNVKAAEDLGVDVRRFANLLSLGQTVTLDDGRIITPDMVLGSAYPASTMVIVDCPTSEGIKSLVGNPIWKQFHGTSTPSGVHLIVHKYGIWNNLEYLQWAASFGPDVHHLDGSPDSRGDRLTYTAHTLSQMHLSLLDSAIYKIPYYQNTIPQPSQLLPNVIPLQQSTQIQMQPRRNPTQVVRSKADQLALPLSSTELNTQQKLMKIVSNLPLYTNAVTTARAAAQAQLEGFSKKAAEPGDDIVLTTLGTGSSISTIHRNVSGTHLSVPGLGGILLDAGEGTLGQIHRCFGDSASDQLLDLRLIFISHMHADHHAGLSTLLKKWYELYQRHSNDNSLYIIGPSPIGVALAELEGFQSMGCHLEGPVKFIDSIAFTECDTRYSATEIDKLNMAELSSSLNFSLIDVPRVYHRGTRCFGISLTHNDGWKITYSGDAIPSESLIKAGMDSTLLIHEATFPDSDAAMAKIKSHSTVSEAISVGERMRAKNVILTHFTARLSHSIIRQASSKNSSIPLPFNLGFAFDLMSLPIKDIWKLPLYQSAIELLYSEAPLDADESSAGVSTSETLSKLSQKSERAQKTLQRSSPRISKKQKTDKDPRD